MKFLPGILIFTLCTLAALAQEAALTDEVVIKMVQSGVPTDTIVRTITTADKVNFSFLPTDLAAMSNARVPDEVFKAMARRDKAAAPVPPSVPVQAAKRAAPSAETRPTPIAPSADDEKALTILSDPPGARVIINGRDRGITPFQWKLGKWAFETAKKSIFAKRLSEPVNVEISMEGYRTETANLARGPFIWRSLNGQNSYSYWVINSPQYSVRLRPMSRTLTNADVIAMLKSGLTIALVIDKIQTSACEFRTDLPDIAELQRAGVPEAVISAMIHALPVDQTGPPTSVQPTKK